MRNWSKSWSTCRPSTVLLTPYTLFLADEQAPCCDVASFRREANLVARDARPIVGESGVAECRQGDFAAGGTIAGSRFGSSSRGGSDAFYFDAKSDKRVSVQTVRTIGSKTFYLRNGKWVDASVTAEQEKQAHEIKRFSDEYFDLATKHGKDVAKYLAIDEPVIIKLMGRCIRIRP